MDAALKAKWVEALRSGEFEQTRGEFKSDDGFCCLGVLCVVAGEPPLCVNESGDNEGNWLFVTAVLGDDPKKDGMRWELVNLNDRVRKTFPEIADYIEVVL